MMIIVLTILGIVHEECDDEKAPAGLVGPRLNPNPLLLAGDAQLGCIPPLLTVREAPVG